MPAGLRPQGGATLRRWLGLQSTAPAAPLPPAASPLIGLPPGHSLDVISGLGGPAAIEAHTAALRAWLYEQLSGLRHSNGAPLLRILGRHHWHNRRAWAWGAL